MFHLFGSGYELFTFLVEMFLASLAPNVGLLEDVFEQSFVFLLLLVSCQVSDLGGCETGYL
jgi:hypothetical protein